MCDVCNCDLACIHIRRILEAEHHAILIFLARVVSDPVILPFCLSCGETARITCLAKRLSVYGEERSTRERLVAFLLFKHSRQWSLGSSIDPKLSITNSPRNKNTLYATFHPWRLVPCP